MIEAYLRANNMFVDYNEVEVFPAPPLPPLCMYFSLDILNLRLMGLFQYPASTRKSLLIICRVGPSKCRTLYFRTKTVMSYFLCWLQMLCSLC